MERDDELIRDWAAALVSGQYTQTTKKLHDDTGFCCLGVLCDVAVKTGKVKGHWQMVEVVGVPYYKFVVDREGVEGPWEADDQFLPRTVADLVGLTPQGEVAVGSGGSWRDWDIRTPDDDVSNWTALASFNDNWMERDEVFPAVADALRRRLLGETE